MQEAAYEEDPGIVFTFAAGRSRGHGCVCCLRCPWDPWFYRPRYMSLSLNVWFRTAFRRSIDHCDRPTKRFVAHMHMSFNVLNDASKLTFTSVIWFNLRSFQDKLGRRFHAHPPSCVPLHRSPPHCGKGTCSLQASVVARGRNTLHERVDFIETLIREICPGPFSQDLHYHIGFGFWIMSTGNSLRTLGRRRW